MDQQGHTVCPLNNLCPMLIKKKEDELKPSATGPLLRDGR